MKTSETSLEEVLVGDFLQQIENELVANVLADLYEERGRVEEATAVRWMFRNRKRPRKSDSNDELYYDWWWYYGPTPDDKDEIPLDIWFDMEDPSGRGIKTRRFETFQDATRELGRVLIMKGIT